MLDRVGNDLLNASVQHVCQGRIGNGESAVVGEVNHGRLDSGGQPLDRPAQVHLPSAPQGTYGVANVVEQEFRDKVGVVDVRARLVPVGSRSNLQAHRQSDEMMPKAVMQFARNSQPLRHAFGFSQ